MVTTFCILRGINLKVILSIHPKFVEKIFLGEKRYEYRKAIFKKNVESILIYATKPVGKIVGEILFEEVISGDLRYVWNETYEYSGISEEFFFEYFKNKEVAHAIKINNLIKYDKPIELPVGIKAPQSYCYVNLEE